MLELSIRGECNKGFIKVCELEKSRRQQEERIVNKGISDSVAEVPWRKEKTETSQS